MSRGYDNLPADVERSEQQDDYPRSPPLRRVGAFGIIAARQASRTLYERITIVAPADGKGWWELARLRLADGDFAGARSSLTSMLETVRDHEQREAVFAALDAIQT